MCGMCKAEKLSGKPSIKDKRRALAPDHPVGPRSVRKQKRPWVILEKPLRRTWWRSKTEMNWRVQGRYATQRARDEAFRLRLNSPYYGKYFDMRVSTEEKFRKERGR